MDEYTIKQFHDAYIYGNALELDKLWHQIAPKSLIKFFPAKYEPTGLNFFIDHLKCGTLWLSLPSHFNDPFDGTINFDCYSNLVDLSIEVMSPYIDRPTAQRFVETEYAKSVFIPIKNSIQKDFDSAHSRLEKSVYATCFSEPANLYSLRMWAYYANSHTGVCAEYSFAQVNQSTPFGCIPIKYTNTYEYTMYPQNISEDTSNFLKLYTKSQEWEYEKEWRVCQKLEDFSGNGLNIPFTTPKKIYFGCRATDRLKSEVINLCSDKPIEIYQMEVRKNSFALDTKRLL